MTFLRPQPKPVGPWGKSRNRFRIRGRRPGSVAPLALFKARVLGLEKAAAAFCSELFHRHRVEIDFHCENIPKRLPPEISICLFRVLQEALQNAIKHSGSRHLRVWLRGGAAEIELAVHDSGVGFEPEEVIRTHGLGIISMKERLNESPGSFLFS